MFRPSEVQSQALRGWMLRLVATILLLIVSISINAVSQDQVIPAASLGMESIEYILIDSVSNVWIIGDKRNRHETWRLDRVGIGGASETIIDEKINQFGPSSAYGLEWHGFSDGVLLGTGQTIQWLGTNHRTLSSKCDSCYHSISSSQVLGDSCVFASSFVGRVTEFFFYREAAVFRIEGKQRLEKIYRDSIVPILDVPLTFGDFQTVVGCQITGARQNPTYVLGIHAKKPGIDIEPLLLVVSSDTVHFQIIDGLQEQSLYQAISVVPHPETGFVAIVTLGANKFQYPGRDLAFAAHVSNDFKLIRKVPLPDWVRSDGSSFKRNNHWISSTSVDSALELNLITWQLRSHSSSELKSRLGIEDSAFGIIGLYSTDSTTTITSRSSVVRLRHTVSDVDQTPVKTHGPYRLQCWVHNQLLYYSIDSTFTGEFVRLDVFNTQGELVSSVVNVMGQARHFYVGNIANGAYIVRATLSDNTIIIGKLLHL